MTQVETRQIVEVGQQLQDFISMYREDRKTNLETHDTVIALKTEQKTMQKCLDAHGIEIKEIKDAPSKRHDALSISIIAAIVAAVISGLIAFFFSR